MPPKANKIATAMAAVNRTVVRNVKAVNRAVVKNYNAANRAINRAPAWVKWTIAAIAVVIIVYAIWKVFFAPRREGFESSKHTKLNGQDWTKAFVDKKLNTEGLVKFNINNDSGVNMYGNAANVINTENTIGVNRVYYSMPDKENEQTVDPLNIAARDCFANAGCQGFEYLNKQVRFIGKGAADLTTESEWENYLEDFTGGQIWLKGHIGAATTDPEADTGSKPQGTISNEWWGKPFENLNTDDKYMVYWRNTTVSGTNGKISTIKSEQKKSAGDAINALKNATDANILVFNGEGTYWLRKAFSKDDFRGAVVTDTWTSESPLANQVVTVIKKGSNLNFNNFNEIVAKTKETVDTGTVVGGGSGDTGGGTQGTRTEFDSEKDVFSYNKNYFESNPVNSGNYILINSDVRFATSVYEYKPYGENPKSFELCFNTFNGSNSTVMVYRRSDGHCWFKNPRTKEDFVGASLIASFPSVGNDGSAYTTVIRKSLEFSTELDVINKANEKPVGPLIIDHEFKKVKFTIPQSEQLYSDTPLTQKECSEKGYAVADGTHTSVVFHNSSKKSGDGNDLFYCWSQNLNDKNVLVDAKAEDSSSENDKIITFSGRTINNMTKDTDLATSTAFNAWAEKNKTFNIATDYFFIKTPDGKPVGTKVKDFGDKLCIGDADVCRKYAFKFENGILKAYWLLNDNTINNTVNSKEIKLRQDATTAGSTVVNSFVIVENGGDDSIKTFKFEPKGNDTYHIFAGRSGDVSIPVVESITSDPPIRFIGAYAGRPPTLFTLEKVRV